MPKDEWSPVNRWQRLLQGCPRRIFLRQSPIEKGAAVIASKNAMSISSDGSQANET